MKMLTPDHNPALRGRRIVIRLKRRSRTIFREVGPLSRWWTAGSALPALRRCLRNKNFPLSTRRRIDAHGRVCTGGTDDKT